VPRWRPQKTEVIKIRCTKQTRDDWYRFLEESRAETAEDGLRRLLDLWRRMRYDVSSL